MPFNEELSGAQLAIIRGASYKATQYMSVLSNTVVFKAQVASDSATDTYVQLDFINVVTGAYTDIKVGHTVFICATDNIRAPVLKARIRASADSDTIFIGKSSTPLSSGWYIFIIDDYRIHRKLPYWDSTTATLYEDETITFHALRPYIRNVKSAYAGFVDGTGFYQIAFTPVGVASARGASISSYLWDIADGTYVVGDANTQNITAKFPASTRERWIHLTVTDSNSQTQTRHIPIWAHNLSTHIPITEFESSSITGSSEGYNASVSFFDGVDSLLDETLVVLWDVEYYNGTAQHIVDNIRMCGRLRNERGGRRQDDTYVAVPEDVRFEIDGIGRQLARLNQIELSLTNLLTPLAFGDISYLTTFRAILHTLDFTTTVLTLHSIDFTNTNDFYLARQGLNIKGGNTLSMLNEVAGYINAQAEFSPDGMIRISEHSSMLSSSLRDAVAVITDWEDQDIFNISYSHEHSDLIAVVDATGGSANLQNNTTIVVQSRAPGTARGEYGGTGQLNSQILYSSSLESEAQSELNTRTGHQFARLNTRDTLSVEFPDGYHFLVPTVREWHTFTYTDVTRGFSFDTNTRWLLESISISQDNIRDTKSVSAEFVKETEGVRGQSVPIPEPQTITPVQTPNIPTTPVYPTLPPPSGTTFPPTAPPPGYVPPDNSPATQTPTGERGVYWSTDQLWLGRQLLTASNTDPVEITPPINSNEQIIDAKWGGNASTDLYAMVYDSDENKTRIYHTANAIQSSPTWSAGEQLTGEYQLLRTTSTAGSIYMQRVDTTTGSTTDDYDFSDLTDITFSLGSIDNSRGNPTPSAQNASGVNSATAPLNGAGTTNGIATAVRVNLGSESTVTSVSFQYLHHHSIDNQIILGVVYYDSALTEISRNQVILTNSQDVWRTRTSGTAVTDCQYVVVLAARTSVPTATGTALIDNISITHSSGGTDSVYTAFSDDYGDTFATPETVGTTSLTSIGFDTIKIGEQALCGRAGLVELITTAGDTWANYGSALPSNAKCLFIPRYIPNSNTVSNADTDAPDYVLASSALTGGDESMWSVTDEGDTFTNITPDDGVNYGTAVSNDCLSISWIDARRLAFIGLFDDTRHLYVSSGTLGTWLDRGALEIDADKPRIFKYTYNLIALVNDGVVYISTNYGSTLTAKIMPTENPILGVEFWE